MTELKKFNLPAYINIPLFLYKNEKLDRSSLLLASFIYSLYTAGKKIKVSNSYLSQLLSIKERQVRYDLELLENQNYIKRTGATSNRLINWIYIPESEVIIVEELNTPAIQCRSDVVNNCTLRQSSAGHSGNPVPPYIKEDIKDTTTTSSSNFFEQYKEKELEHLIHVSEEENKNRLSNKFKQESLNDTTCIELYNERFKGLNVTLEMLYEECVDYWSQTEQLVYKARFITHLKKAPLDKYKDFKNIKSKSSITPDDKELIQTYCSLLKSKTKFSAEIEQNIILLKQRLKSIDTSESREALSLLAKTEEINLSVGLQEIIIKSKEEYKISNKAQNNLAQIKGMLK